MPQVNNGRGPCWCRIITATATNPHRREGAENIRLWPLASNKKRRKVKSPLLHVYRISAWANASAHGVKIGFFFFLFLFLSLQLIPGGSPLHYTISLPDPLLSERNVINPEVTSQCESERHGTMPLMASCQVPALYSCRLAWRVVRPASPSPSPNANAFGTHHSYEVGRIPGFFGIYVDVGGTPRKPGSLPVGRVSRMAGRWAGLLPGLRWLWFP